MVEFKGFKFFLPKLSSQNNSTYIVLAYIAIAYIFSFIVRLSLTYSILDKPIFWYENRILPIWTADAGLIGNFAKQILAGVALPYDNIHISGHIIAFLSTFSGLHVDIIMFYAPAFFASLIVIPIILIMATIRLPLIGFFAALFASIGFNYYFRTHLGYTDTDILIFFFIYMILYSMFAGIEKQKIIYSFIGFISIIALSYWYHSYKPLVFGLLLAYIVYILIFERRKSIHYFSFLLLSMASIPMLLSIKIALGLTMIGLWVLTQKYKPKYLDYRIWFSTVVIAIVAFITLVGLSPKYYHRIIDYVQKKDLSIFTDINGTTYHVNASLKSVEEAMGLPFMDMIEYISGSIFLFVISIIGLILLALYRRSTVLLWVMLFLGVSSVLTGVRFSTFAIPLMSIGIFISLFTLLELLKKRYSKQLVSLMASILILAIFYSPISAVHAYNQILQPTYSNGQAKILDDLSKQAKAEDFIVSWWDNGWPLWYATGMRTVIDNGKHHIDNFLVAKILFTSNPILSANMSRYFLEAYAKKYNGRSIIHEISKKQNLQVLLDSLSQKPFIKKEEIDIYYYFDDNLINKIPIMASFSNIDGENQFKNELFAHTFLAKPFQITDRLIHGEGFIMDRGKGTIQTSDGQQGKVGRLIISDGITMKSQQFYKGVDYNLIIYKNRYVLMLSDKYLNSFIVRSLILNQFDPQLFKLVSYSNDSIILKLLNMEQKY